MASKLFPNAMRKALIGAAFVAVPGFAFAGTGPYLGVEGGGNWVGNETYRTAPGLQQKDVFGWAAGVTGGYKFENGLRPEIELVFRTNALRNSLGRSNVPAGMANLWYDFTLPSNWSLDALHPYVGGGIGFGRIDPILSSAPAMGPNSYRSAFLYQGGAGVSYDFTDRLTGDIGYRWIESSKAAFAGTHTDQAVGRYRANTAMVALRYSFGAAPVVAPVPPPPPPVAEVPPPPPAKPACNPPAGFQVDADCNIIPQKIILRSVNFKFNKATLTDAAKVTLNSVAVALKKQPSLDVQVQGHTDSVGSVAYNNRLSQQRANSVRSYLISQGVNGANLTAKGYGPSKPIASNKTSAGRTLNRRVEFEVTNHVQHVQTQSGAPTTASVDAAARK